jgi:hypothetical protein
MEPVRLVALLTAAVTVTFNLVGLVLDWAPELLAAVNIAAGAWIAVAGEIVRARVTPNQSVALTVDEAHALNTPGGDLP